MLNSHAEGLYHSTLSPKFLLAFCDAGWAQDRSWPYQVLLTNRFDTILVLTGRTDGEIEIGPYHYQNNVVLCADSR